MKFLIGNWKANKNLEEVEKWFAAISAFYQKSDREKLSRLQIVLCPAFIYLSLAKQLIDKYRLPMKLGAQNSSPFENGAYTGEISAEMIGQYAEFVLIGHSERRNYFKEEEEMLTQKVKQAKRANLKTIYCVQNEEKAIPPEVTIVAYEPPSAIGTGLPDTPVNADRVAAQIKNKWGIKTVIYGGSVLPDNIADFLQTPNIDGVLPGGASLDPQKFWEMIVNASGI